MVRLYSMKEFWRIPARTLILCFFLLSMAVPAYGYIDPNASGLISQMVTPMLIVVAAGVTFLRTRIRTLLTGLRRRFGSHANT